MSVSVFQVETKKDLQRFIDLPWEIYKNDPLWVPPLKMAVQDLLSEKHPFRKTADMRLFLAEKGGQAVGRIAAVVNRAHNQFHGELTGHFGLFECIDDKEVAQDLMAAAMDITQKAGMKKLVGPVNPSTNYECGLLVEGPKDPPQIMMTYNPPYYARLFQELGLVKEKDLIAYRLNSDIQMPEKVRFISDRVEKKSGVTFRPISKKHWNRDINLMYELYNDAWEKNWGFVPMLKEEFFHTAKDLKAAVIEELVLFVEKDGEAVGFIVALPDFNQIFKRIPNGKLLPTGIFKLLFGKKHVTRSRIITLGLKQKYRRSGLETVLYTKIQDMMKKVGLKEVEMSWILEDNLEMNRPLILMGALPYKRYRIYSRDI